ncbi:MAG TPA: peptidase, partial [Mizugakiibacter sp.]|nr:peptidase [Mizugakiibacter sp.]
MKQLHLRPAVLALGIVLSFGANATTTSNTVFNVKQLDNKVSACVNLNQFVNAKWIAANPIPADKTRWGAFDELREKSLEVQKQIVVAAAQHANQAQPGSIKQKIGWLYESGMNTAAIDKAGLQPLQPELQAIKQIMTPPQLLTYIYQSFAKGQGGL